MNEIILLVAESGSGKSYLTDRLCEKYPDTYQKILSTVSRDRRDGEMDGVDYKFSSKAEILKDIRLGEMVQLACVGGNLYGTFMNDYLSVRKKGVLAVFPDHVFTVANFIRGLDPMIKVTLVFFDVTDNLLKKHLGDDFDKRVGRFSIRKDFKSKEDMLRLVVDHYYTLEDGDINDQLSERFHNRVLGEFAGE